MKHSISFIMCEKFKGRQWSLEGNNYDDLNILDDLPKPTLNELEQASLELELLDYKPTRKGEYNKRGLLDHELIVALWEHVIEERPEMANKLQAIRESVKQGIPKPKEL